MNECFPGTLRLKQIPTLVYFILIMHLIKIQKSAGIKTCKWFSTFDNFKNTTYSDLLAESSF